MSAPETPKEVKIVKKYVEMLDKELAAIGFKGYFEYSLTTYDDVPVIFSAIITIDEERYKAAYL